MTWRVGHKLGRTLYEGDSLIGMMDTEDLARIVVDAVNARAEALVPRLRLRTRAEVDAEIAALIRTSVRVRGVTDDCLCPEAPNNNAKAQRIRELVAEPLAPDPPEACSCDEALNRTTDELRARLVNIYRLTLTGGEDAVTLRAIRAASAPGAPAPGRQYTGTETQHGRCGVDCLACAVGAPPERRPNE